MASTGGSEKTSVQVALRIRPITNEDTANLPTRFQRQVLTASAPNQVIVQADKKQVFSYDFVFGPEATQQDVYDKAIVKLVDNFLEGYNVTILAYGQTSSGKTHTMGTADNHSISPESKGIIPRAMQTLFSLINSPQNKTRKFSLKVSFIEIYNEDLIDLLGESYGDSRPQVTIREDTKGNILWSGLQEMKVNGVDDVMGHLARGSANRQVGATDMNAQSSRSHAIFSVTMTQQKLANPSTTQTSSRPGTPSKMLEPKIRSQSSVNNLRLSRRFDEGDFVTLTSKFHFVDLAGSERLKRSAAVGERAKEGISINSGLLALGNVISALGDPSKAKHTTHIPYRDSKLTRLLQDSLGGNAQTLMIACVSPAEYNLNETVNTLKYANRARNIKNTVVVNQEEVGWNDIEHLQSLVLKLRSEIKALKLAPSTSNGGSNNSSGRNTPIQAHTNNNDTLPPPSRLARPKSPLTINTDPTITNNKDKDIENLEGQYMHLQRSYAELTRKHAKTSAELAKYQDNSDEPSGDLKTNGTNKKDSQHDSSFQEAVEPVVEEYEKSISSLESQLALARAALNHSEKMIHDQEAKIDDAERLSEQNRNLIIDLRNKIAQLYEREENSENYIKDLESRLETHSKEQKKDQELINELKSKLSQLKSNGSNSEGYIQDLESRLASSEGQFVKLNQTIERLEKRLQEREADYAELETKMRQSNTDEEKKMLLGAVDERDRRIIQLEQNVNELVIELEKLRQLKDQEHELSNDQDTHKRSDSNVSLTSEDERLVSYTPIANGLSFKDEQDRLLVIDLEKKLSILQLTHEKTVEEFAEIKAKYQACIDEINDLQAQLNEARMINSELVDNFRCTTPSTPLTPMTPQSTSSPTPLQTPYRFEENGKDPFDSGLIAVKKRELHRKSKSLSGDIRGSEKRDLAQLAIVQKLQMDLKQLENKTVGMDSINKEFSRLQMSHRATLDIVEELREEIKKRDTLAQLEIMSIKKEHFNQPDSAFTTELDELEIVSRLRKEVENLKEEQKRTIEKISEYEKVNSDKNEEISQIESKIQSLRDQLLQATQEQNIINDFVTKDDKDIEGLQMKIKELENQLFKIQEDQRLEKIAETASKLEGKNITKPVENVETPEIKNEIKTLQMKVEKLQVEIEAKSHTIAALLLPNDDRLSIIRKLEDEIQEAKQAIEKNNSKLINDVINKNKVSNSISNANSSKQKVDEHVKSLEEKVKDLELQLSKMKEINHIPTSRNSAFHVIDPTQKSIEALQDKLTSLQEQLASKPDSVENMQSVNDLVVALQSQLEILKADLKRKYELIEILKRDLIDKGVLQQKLREKEFEASMLKAQLSEVKDRQEDMQKQMLELQIQLQGVESNKGTDQFLQSEINNMKKELLEVKEKEASSSEQLRVLEAEELRLKQELQRLKNVEITQRERIKLLEAQLSGGNGDIDEDITRLKAEFVLAKESEAEYKSKISELEIKLNKSEGDYTTLRSKVDLLKSKTSERNVQVQNYEHQFNSTAVSTLEMEIGGLKNMKFNLQKTVKELESKLEIAQNESDRLKDLNSEIATLKELESKQKSSIEQLQGQIDIIKGEKDNVNTELEHLRKEYNTQKEYIISLEVELNNVKVELTEAKESNVTSSKKLDDLSKLLETTERQRDELKKMKALENQIQVSRDVESVGKDALEIETRNGIKDELKDKIQALEKERDQYAKRVNELTKTFETKEIEQKQTVATLRSSISILETKLAEAKSSSQFDKSTITNLGSKLASVGTLFGEAKASEDKHIKMTRELEERLREANNALLIKEKMLINKDTCISELEVTLQKTRKDLEDAKLSSNSETKHVKELQTRLYELETKLLERPSSSELEAAKQTAAKQSELVKELEMKLASMEQFSPTGSTTNLDAIALVTKQLEEAKIAEAVQVELVKKLETTLKDKQENLEKLQDTMAKVNSELEAVKKSEMEQKELIIALEAQLKVAEDKCLESSRNENVNLENSDEEDIINNYSKDDNTIEDLTNQLNEAHNKAKAYNDRVEELEKITKQLEADNKNQLDANVDLTKQVERYQKELESLTEEYTATATKYDDADIISKEQKIRIVELEKALEGVQTQNGTLSSHKSTDSLTDSYDTYGSSSNTTLSKLAVANENLRQINDNLRAKVSSVEGHVTTLKSENRNLEKELGHLKNTLDGVTVEELKEKITEIEAEKEGLEQANNAFKEECKKLDQKIESLVKQLQSAGRGGNRSAAQLAELNNKLIALEREYNNLKQKSLVDAQGMEDEITSLLDINENLEKEIGELRSQISNEKPKNLEIKSQDTPKLNGSDNSVRSKLKRQEGTIAQQNSLIKVLQDKINDLERRVETETKYRRPSFGTISISDQDGPFGSTGVRLSSVSIMSGSSNRTIRPNMIAAANLPPPTPPPTQPLPPTPPPNQPLPPTPDSLPSSRPFTPPPSRLFHSRNGSNDISTEDLANEIQKLHRKIAKIEGENIQNKRLVETLENSLDDNEMNLRVAKEQLQILQKEKAVLVEQIKTLESQLNETKVQFEHTRSSVYEEKKFIETELVEERKAKENAEKARKQLESRMEELMAKKSKFICF